MTNDKILPYGKAMTARDIGRFVRRKRKESGATQEQTAALLGVGVRFLSELERGKETVELGKVLRVIDKLGLVTWILPRGITP